MKPLKSRPLFLVAALLACGACITLACRGPTPEETLAVNPRAAASSPPPLVTVTSSPPPMASTMNPKDILFSVPTLCDKLPPLYPPTTSIAAGGVARMHEDDWRQVEFVAESDRPSVERELAELRRFKVDKRSGPGWTDVYVRRSRGDSVRPLGLRLPELLRTAHATSSSDLYIETGGAVAKVRGGFVANIQDVTLYGHAEAGGTVASLGMLTTGPAALEGEARAAILELSRTFALFIVDWHRVEIIAD